MQLKQKHIVDLFKGATAPVMLALLVWFQQWDNTTAWLYLALHGTYGVLWVMKSRIFGDKSWEQPCSPGYGLLIAGALICYWLGGWIVMSQGVQAPPWYLALCVSMFGFGVFFHFAADMQKHMSLKLNPGHLITGELVSRNRNTNYFGELLIYLSFGLLAMHWIPLLVIALMMSFVWVPNMRRKDRSLSRYPEFAGYSKRSTFVIPYIW